MGVNWCQWESSWGGDTLDERRKFQQKSVSHHENLKKYIFTQSNCVKTLKYLKLLGQTGEVRAADPNRSGCINRKSEFSVSRFRYSNISSGFVLQESVTFGPTSRTQSGLRRIRLL